MKNMSFKTKGTDLYDLFGKYGEIRQIRLGNETKTRGTAYVVYQDSTDVCAARSSGERPADGIRPRPRSSI